MGKTVICKRVTRRKQISRRNQRLFAVDKISEVRWNERLEYLTHWRGFKTPSWNHWVDFPSSFNKKLLQLDFQAIVPKHLEEAALLYSLLFYE
jgi:hypothetical protein